MRESLRCLCGLPGVSGDEGQVRQWLLEQIGGLAACRTDALGNLIAEKKGRERPHRRLLFCTQMDAYGLSIRGADEEGNLHFACIGNLPAAVLAGKAVRIGEAGIVGVIGVKPVHLLEGEERDCYPKIEDLVIDIGARDAAGALAKIQPGDRAVFDSGFAPFGERLLRGRALDSRAGCALLLSLLQEELPYDCTFAFTVLGETGGAGAQTAAYAIAPEMAVFVGAAAAGDLPGVSHPERACALGKGPVLPPREGRTLYPAALTAAARQAAAEWNIPLQQQEGGLSCAIPAALQGAGNGLQLLSVLLPCRYPHTPLPVISESDLQGTAQLLRALAGALPRL